MPETHVTDVTSTYYSLKKTYQQNVNENYNNVQEPVN